MVNSRQISRQSRLLAPQKEITMRPTRVFAILAVAGLMFAFSLGVLTSRAVSAQGPIGSYIPPYFRTLPFQRDLWQFSGNGTSTWDSEGGHIFTVRLEPNGYLPVVTQFHQLDLAIYREVDGSWKLWVYGNRNPSQSSDFVMPNVNIGIGFILQPGRYKVYSGTLSLASHHLLLSGYWAPR